jgi:hypothetical protein
MVGIKWRVKEKIQISRYNDQTRCNTQGTMTNTRRVKVVRSGRIGRTRRKREGYLLTIILSQNPGGYPLFRVTCGWVKAEGEGNRLDYTVLKIIRIFFY